MPKIFLGLAFQQWHKMQKSHLKISENGFVVGQVMSKWKKEGRVGSLVIHKLSIFGAITADRSYA